MDVAELPSEREFMDALWGIVTQIFGEYGASQAGLVLITFNLDRRLAIVRVNLPAVINVRAAITTLTEITGKPAAIHVIGVSGTIKALCKQL